MKSKLISMMMKLLFYQVPEIVFTDQEINDYEKLYKEAINGEGLVHYTSSYPKQRFIQYIARNKNVLLHGSNNLFIQEFETRRQNPI